MTRKRLILMAVVALSTLAADQATKHLARTELRDPDGRGRVIDVIEGYLALEYHENPGMAFGIGRNWAGGRFILIGVGLAALFLVWRLVRHVERRQKAADIAFGLVAGGAIGNLVDRVHIGRVVDFVVMHWQRKAQWPAYNIADAALVAGVILLVLVLGGRQQGAAVDADARARVSKRGRRKAR